MSSVDLPAIQTNFSPYSTPSASSPSSRPYCPSPSSSPAMSYARSFSNSSISSRLSSSSLYSQYSASDRSMSSSPGPATPCDMMSRSPSFSQERIAKGVLPPLKMSQHSMPASFPPPQRFSNPSQHPHAPTSLQQYRSASPTRHAPIPQSRPSYHHHPYHPSSPREKFSCPASSPARDDHQNHPMSPRRMSERGLSSPSAFSEYPRSPYSHHHYQSPMPLSPSHHAMFSRGVVTPPPVNVSQSPFDREYGSSMSRSPSISSVQSFSRDNSPFGSENDDYVSPASVSMTSLSSTDSASSSAPSCSSNTQLLLCPVCSRAFKPSKNQNCNLRRHLKNVHNMSPTMHPRKCKWDSLPDGRVKDDKDRKERTRKSKRLWARKFRLRRKVEEAAVVLSMLSQAV
ncbi:hypothetical protein BG005_000924 [Podila minutissima]|nr:hypothetical protein BG005_000924 [Podila minutissima]